MSEQAERYVLTFPDYEDADAERVARMRLRVARLGAEGIFVSASEGDGEAKIIFRATDEVAGMVRDLCARVGMGWALFGGRKEAKND